MKFLKKSVSVFLAVLMIFGTFSILATAADEAEFNWSLDTKFYRMQRNADGHIVNDKGQIIADKDDKFFTLSAEDGKTILDAEGNAVTIENAAVGTPVWIPTTTAKKGESVKARVFMDTDFLLSSADMMFYYPSEFLTFDPSNYSAGTANNTYSLVTNKNIFTGNIVSGTGFAPIFDNMVYEGYITEADLEGQSWIALTPMKPSSGPVMLDGSDWFFEIDFKVNKEPTNKGQFYLSVECIADWDYYMSITVIGATVDGDEYLSCDEPLGTFAYTLNDTDDDSSITTTSNVVFENPVFDESGNPVYVQAVDENGEPKEDADGKPVYVQKTQLALNEDGYPYLDENYNWVYEDVKDAEGNPVYVQKTTKVAGYSASLGDKLSSIADFAVPTVSADGKQFLGWSLDGNTKLTAEEIDALEVDYNTITLTAMYQAATADYIYNLYVMDKEGEYPEKPADKDPVGANTGDKIEYVETLPEKPEADVTYVVFGTKGFTLDTSKNTSPV